MFWEKGYINEARETTELLVYWELYVRHRKSMISHFSALSLVCYKKYNGFMKKYLIPETLFDDDDDLVFPATTTR